MKKSFSCLAVFWVLSVSFVMTGAASAETLLERGKYLMNGVVACGNCHTPRTEKSLPVPGREFAGGLKWDEKPFTTYAANITQDKETGIGSWTDEQMFTALRTGKRPDGSLIGPPMPGGLYVKLSDRVQLQEDVRSVRFVHDPNVDSGVRMENLRN